MSLEIETTVSALLASYGVTYESHYSGVKKNALGGTTEMDEWIVGFSKDNVSEEFDYFTGMGNRSKVTDTALGRMAAASLKGSHPNSLAWEAVNKQYRKPVSPSAAGVLYSLIHDSEAGDMTFHNWCDEFGYDDDSISARNTYDACQENADKLMKIFNKQQIEQLQEALQDY
ncbi:hypothetical protein D3C87_324950 [compost metagenome]